MGISASRPASGANAGRGDNPHFAEMAARVNDENKTKYAKEMGIPKQWVTGSDTAKFSGRVVGWDGIGGANKLWLSAESTGGGVTDSHQIEWTHHLMDSSNPHAFNKFFGVNTSNPERSQKWTAEGKMVRSGLRADSPMRMQWMMRPHNPEWDD